MKVTDGVVDWGASHSSRPRITLSFEGEALHRADADDGLRYEARSLFGEPMSDDQVHAVGGHGFRGTPCTLYYALRDGFVRYFVEDPSNPHGYGGSIFNVVLTDGTKRSIKGPWSGGASGVNAAGFPPVIDVSSNHCARSLLVSALEPFLHLIRFPSFDPTAGTMYGPGWYEQNGPRVDFPPGSVLRLYADDAGVYLPEVLRPDGTVWRKPTTDQRTPARHAELAMLDRAKQYVGSGPIGFPETVPDLDDEQDRDVDEDRDSYGDF